MKSTGLISLAPVLLVGCTKPIDKEEDEVVVKNADDDGFVLEDDCDDGDASINPDAE